MTIEEAVRRYLELRDLKAQLKLNHDEQFRPLDEEMNRIEATFLKHFDEIGIDSMKTKAGTVYTSTRVSVSVADKDALLNYAREHDEWPLIEVRASKQAVEQYVEEHQEPPPGVNIREDRTVNIRRGK